jgi:hypothetical protein
MFQLIILKSSAIELLESSQSPVRQLLRCLRLLLFKIKKCRVISGREEGEGLTANEREATRMKRDSE